MICGLFTFIFEVRIPLLGVVYVHCRWRLGLRLIDSGVLASLRHLIFIYQIDVFYSGLQSGAPLSPRKGNSNQKLMLVASKSKAIHYSRSHIWLEPLQRLTVGLGLLIKDKQMESNIYTGQTGSELTSAVSSPSDSASSISSVISTPAEASASSSSSYTGSPRASPVWIMEPRGFSGCVSTTSSSSPGAVGGRENAAFTPDYKFNKLHLVHKSSP